MVSFVVTLITEALDFLLMLGSNVLCKISLSQCCEFTLWAMYLFSLAMLLFDMRCDSGPPP